MKITSSFKKNQKRRSVMKKLFCLFTAVLALGSFVVLTDVSATTGSSQMGDNNGGGIAANPNNNIIQSRTNYDQGVGVNVVNYNDNTTTILSGGKQMKVTQTENPGVVLMNFNYDNSGNLVNTIDNLGNKTNYDVTTGRQTSVQNSDGFTTATYEYNAKGSLTTVVSWGKVNTNKTDTAGNIIQQTVELSRTNYEAGKMVSVEGNSQQVNDDKSLKYDNSGNAVMAWSTQMTYEYAKGTNDLVSSTSKDGSKTYYVNGKQSYSTNPEGAVVQRFNYDSKTGKLVSTSGYTDDKLVSVTKYDVHGRQSEVFDGHGNQTAKFTYNDTGVVKNMTVDGVSFSIGTGACEKQDGYIRTYSEDGTLAYTQVQTTYFKQGDTQRSELTVLDNAATQVNNDLALSKVINDASGFDQNNNANRMGISGTLSLRDNGQGAKLWLTISGNQIASLLAPLRQQLSALSADDKTKDSNVALLAVYNNLLAQSQGNGSISVAIATVGPVRSVDSTNQAVTTTQTVDNTKMIDMVKNNNLSVSLTMDFWSVDATGNFWAFVDPQTGSNI
jgi:YD repeat-containing protein